MCGDLSVWGIFALRLLKKLIQHLTYSHIVVSGLANKTHLACQNTLETKVLNTYLDTGSGLA